MNYRLPFFFSLPLFTAVITLFFVTDAHTEPPVTSSRILTPLQQKVTQQNGTEAPFKNAYWDNKAEGIYVDLLSGEPLFSSIEKYASGSGWPSFTDVITGGGVVTREDRSLFSVRTEVRSRYANSHLGHVFPDGPGKTGLRYCINSASLHFVPKDELHKQGYARFEGLFNNESATTSFAVLAGGCFWGMEELLRALPGVVNTQVGYAGGHTLAPDYSQVKTGSTGHAEAVQIEFDPSVISYSKLLEAFFRVHDPTSVDRQGNDRGTQYRSLILTTNPAHAGEAQAMIARVNASGFWPKPVATVVHPLGPFYDAETYHQDYLQHNPNGYTCHLFREDYL